MRKPHNCLAGGVIVVCIISTAANAETFTLSQALATAYETNPQLDAQRAALRAADEEVAKALAGWRPSISASGNYGYEHGEYHAIPGSTVGTNPRGATVTITQPLLNGTTLANTRHAKAVVEAGRSQLSSIEQNVLLSAATAYIDVVRNQVVVDLEQRNVTELKRLQTAVEQRFRIGELSRTDVAQTIGRLNGAMTDLTNAQNQLTASRAAFEHAIGRPPESLEQRPVLPPAPESYDLAVGLALQNNPVLLAAREQASAADYAVDAAMGNLLPSLSFQGQYQKSVDQVAAGVNIDAASVVLQLVIPLYQGGADHAAVRQTKEQRSQAVLNIADVERQVRELVRTASEGLRTSRDAIMFSQEQVEANEVAYEGVQQETRVGARTILDVLNADQELLNARIALVTARRNEFVATYQLLSGTGELTAKGLSLPAKLYDPLEHYNKDATRWIGFGE